MKISKLFHWLYFILMMLPLFGVVSTFAYYSFNKNASVPTVTETISKEVDFNQMFDFENANLQSMSVVDSKVYITNSSGSFINNNSRPLYFNHKYYVKCKYVINYSSDADSPYTLALNLDGHTTFILNSIRESRSGSFSEIITLNQIPNGSFIRFSVYTTAGITFTDSYIYNLQVFDLTQMFGAGNEPTIVQFNTWFPNDYYEYTTSDHIVIENYSTQEVSDSAINHFWLPSFGGLSYVIQNVYLTLVGSLFGFSIASGVGYVVVELLTYWTAISIIYLIFDVFMYLPLLVHKWLDRAKME